MASKVVNKKAAKEVREFIRSLVAERKNKNREKGKRKAGFARSLALANTTEATTAGQEELGKVRFFKATVDNKKGRAILDVSPVPVEVCTPYGWVEIKELYNVEEICGKCLEEMTDEEKSAYEEYVDLCNTFSNRHLQAQVILETTDVSNVEVKGKDNLPAVLEAIEQHENIPFSREFVWVDGAKDTKGVIILPYDDYSDVFVVSDPDEEGKVEITFVQSKEETGGVRPYYEKKDGKTYIYVDHFSGGGGTQSDPYIVSNETDLNNVRNNLGAWYVQDQDIVMGSFQTGTGFEPIGTSAAPFTGVYDGQGFYIKSLYMNQNRNDVGLFGYTRSATIRNLRLIDPNIIGQQQTVGAIVGFGYNTQIQNCNVIGGSVEGWGGYVGGLVGQLYTYSIYAGRSDLYYCYNHKCHVKTRGNVAGGLVGRVYWTNLGVSVNHCYSNGKVEDITVAKDRVNLGGLIGANNDASGSNVYDSFWDMEKSTKQTSAGGTGKSTAEMKLKSTYENWDFQLYWHLSDDYNDGYPEHRQFIRYRHGKGTQAEPFIITNEFELSQMRWWRKSHFKFEDDVKMIEHQTGAGFYPIGFDLTGKEQYFSGVVDGAGRCVANLFMYRPNDYYVSLFGKTYGATIKNLDVIDCDITGGNHTAGLVGYAEKTYVTNCHVDTFNACRITSKANHGAGMVGYAATDSIFEDCSVNCVVAGVSYVGMFVGGIYNNAIVRRCYAAGRGENTGSYLGGFVGFSDNSTTVIEDCYTVAELNGTSVGAFAGYYQHGSIRRCLALNSKVYASNGLSGFLNGRYGGGNTPFSDNYYDKELLKGASSSYGAVGKTSAEMKHPFTYATPPWDFTDVWILDSKYNNGYPALRRLLPMDLPILGFRNEFGKYYTDNAGQILRYLDFGTLIASQTSVPKAVWLQNNADFHVTDMKVWVDPATVAAGMKVELSISETPFIGSNEITFSGTYSKGSAAKFFVRISSDISVKTGGTFDLRAKASPV